MLYFERRVTLFGTSSILFIIKLRSVIEIVLGNKK